MEPDPIVILFVDDERIVLNALRRSLIHAPYTVCLAESGRDALALLAEQPVDIIVADLRMPEMDGIALLKRVRDAYPDIVRLVLSASLDQDLILETINSGEVFRFLGKPIESAGQLLGVFDQAAALVRLRRRAMEVDRLKAEFMASITHELKSPLASIKGYTETVLRDRGMDVATREAFLATAISECDRLMQLIDSVLDLSRIEAGAFALRFAPTDLGLLIEETVGTMRRMFENAQIKLMLDTPESVPEVPADRERLIQVLRNLLDNALKYTPQGGRVTVTLKETDGALSIRVADNGVGIASDELPRVCERFFRGRQAASRNGGAGLGLAVATEILDRHGWSLDMDSQPDYGTTATVLTGPASVRSPNPPKVRHGR